MRKVIPTREAELMFEALQAAFKTFLDEYTRKKGSEEISDVELQAAGRGFKHIVDGVIEETNRRLEKGDTTDLRLAPKISLRPAPSRVTLTPENRR